MPSTSQESSAQTPQVPSAFAATPTRTGTVTRRSIVAGAAWTAPLVVAAASAPLAAANGRLLSGNLLGANFDDLTFGLLGASVKLNGNEQDEDVNSLANNVLALVSSVLSFASNAQELGLLGQYAYAGEDATSDGSSGLIGTDGVIDFGSPNGAADLGRLDLRTLLSTLGGAGDLVASLTDLDLAIGAVGGRTYVNTRCNPPGLETAPPVGARAAAALKAQPTDGIEREYLLAYLRLVLESQLVRDLGTALTAVLGPNAISLDTTKLLTAIRDALGPLGALVAPILALGSSALSATVIINTSQLTTQAIPNTPNAALQVNLGAGTATIDLAALLGGAYTENRSKWLNELGPNTRLLADVPLPTGGVVKILDDSTTALIDRLKDLITVRVALGNVGAPSLGNLLPTGLLIEGSLRAVLDGSATAWIQIAGGRIELGNTVGPLLSGVGNLVTDALNAILRPNGVANALFAPVNLLLSRLFTALVEVAVITVNAQNDGTAKDPFPVAQNVGSFGRFETAALHVGAANLGGLNTLNLFLARGSGGPNPVRSGTGQRSGGTTSGKAK